MARLGNALINVLPPLIHARLNLFQLRKCLFVVLCNSSPTSLVFSRGSSSVSLPKNQCPVKALEGHFIPNSLWNSWSCWRRRNAAGLDIWQKEDIIWQEFHLIFIFFFFKFTAANKKKECKTAHPEVPSTSFSLEYTDLSKLKCFMSVLVFTEL